MNNRPVLFALVLLVAAALSLASLPSASAQGGSLVSNGIVVGVQPDDEGRLERFAIADTAGKITEFSVQPGTEYGLETQAGDRWVSNQADDPVEVVARMRDHQNRFAAVTVTSQNGVALSVVERESGKLETNLGYLFAIFAITWAGLFAYIFFVSRKQRELKREIARLRAGVQAGHDQQ